MTLKSYAWQCKLIALIDNATDEILAGVAKDLTRCYEKDCKICPLTAKIIKLVRKLRDVRNEEMKK